MAGSDAVLFAILQTALRKANPSGLPSNLTLQNFAMPQDTLGVASAVAVTTTVLGYPYGSRLRTAQYAPVVLADQPVAYWPLTEVAGTTARDVTGNGYNGTLQGGVTPGQPGPLFSGEPAMGLDGSTGYIAAPPTLQPPLPLTLEAWIYLTSYGANGGDNVTMILACDPGPRIGVTQTTYGGGAGALWASIQIAGSWYMTTVSPPNAIPLNQWTHVAVTFANGTMTGYVNGATTGSGSFGSGAIGYGSNPFAIGADDYGTPHELLAGRVGEVAIYPTALTANHLQTHYNAGRGLFSAIVPYGAAWILRTRAQVPPGASASLSVSLGGGTAFTPPSCDAAATLAYGDLFRWQPAAALGRVGASPWGAPSGWPDPTATWLGPSATANTGYPVGEWLLRKAVFLPQSGPYTLSLAADDQATVYVDGQAWVTSTSYTTTTQATRSLNAGWHLLAVSGLTTGAAPAPAGVLLSLQDNQGTVWENGSTDAVVGVTWETTGLLAPSGTTVNGYSDLPYQYAVIPASQMTSNQVQLTVSTTANASGQSPLVQGVDWIVIAPWRWDAGAQYDAPAVSGTPSQQAPRTTVQEVG